LFHCYIFSRSCESDDATMLKYDSATMQKREMQQCEKTEIRKKQLYDNVDKTNNRQNTTDFMLSNFVIICWGHFYVYALRKRCC
jgi:hypothetical protein